MKYSYMSFSTPSLELRGMLEVARRYGYGGIEPRLDSSHAHGIEVGMSQGQRNAARAQVQMAGVELACLATSLSYADPEKASAMLAQTHERIDLAGDLSVKALRVFGGKIPEAVGRKQAIDLLVRSLSSVADHAEDREVTLCLETHDDWCHPEHIVSVLQQVDHVAVAANWDIMHPVRVARVAMDDAFEALNPWIRHVHFHDGRTQAGKLVFLPAGQGEIDHRRAVKLLRGSDYTGFLSGEWIGWEPYDVHLPREIATLREYEQGLL